MRKAITLVVLFCTLCSAYPTTELELQAYLREECNYFNCDIDELNSAFEQAIKDLNSAVEQEIQHIQQLKENEPIVIPDYLKKMLWFKKNNFFDGTKQEYLQKLDRRKEIFLNDLEQRRKQSLTYQRTLEDLSSRWRPESVWVVGIIALCAGALSTLYVQGKP